MSEKEGSSSIKKRSRRQTSDSFKLSTERSNENVKRFSQILMKVYEDLLTVLPEVNEFITKEKGYVVPIEREFMVANKEHKGNLVINVYYENDLSLKRVCCIALNIRNDVFTALVKTISQYLYIRSLHLDFCDLTCAHIEQLQEVLKIKTTIDELSLKGNPNSEQNFYLLIECRLKVLCVKLCKIDHKGLRKIAQEFLKLSPNASLIHLDLSSNMIFDDGCIYVADILRCDRTLQSLNLSDCKITDEGLKELVKSLQKFLLHNEEICVRRKLRFKYFKMLNKIKLELCDINSDIKDMGKDFLDIENLIERHPFTRDTISDNGEVFCKGNYTLEHLNLSYNRLTEQGFDMILKLLMEQSIAFGSHAGLIKLKLNGNSGYNCEELCNVIEEFLQGKSTRKSTASVRSRVSIKKRKSSVPASRTSGLSVEASGEFSQISRGLSKGII